MKTFLTDNLLSIVLILLIIGGLIYFSLQERKYDQQISNMKDTILAKDFLIKIRDGEYTKLVNDTKTTKELKEELKTIVSEQLYKEIVKNGEKITNNTTIRVVPTTKTLLDTVYIDSSGTRRFTSYYPNKDSAFITNQATITGNIASSTWSFQPLKLSVVVTQQKDGMYRARLIGPTWIQAEEVTVNSLPMTSINEKKFKFLLGASGGYSFEDRSMVVGVYTGIRFNNKIILLNGGTNKVVSIGYIQEF